ncbi:MAG: Asp23/Gls24 family envelope stress response protein [Bacteroidota bacterium]
MARDKSNGTAKPLGTINVSPDAVAMVAGIAALECYGVVGMASRGFHDGIAELLRTKDSLAKGISVQTDGDQVTINLYVIVEYGTRIKEVARNVVERVRYTVQSHLGLTVSEVNVIVQGVRTGVKGTVH